MTAGKKKREEKKNSIKIIDWHQWMRGAHSKHIARRAARLLLEMYKKKETPRLYQH